MVKSKLEEYGKTNIILAGDLNTYLDVNIDKKGGKVEMPLKYSQTIKNICEEFLLTDIWRVQNPDIQSTHVEKIVNQV